MMEGEFSTKKAPKFSELFCRKYRTVIILLLVYE